MFIAWTTLIREQEAILHRMSPDEIARYEEFVGFIQFKQNQLRLDAERDAFRLMIGYDPDRSRRRLISRSGDWRADVSETTQH